MLAVKGERAICPFCKGLVIAKCGEIVIHHWAHKSNIDCDTWHEPESQWHLTWKSYFPKDCVEVTLDHSYKRHRADIYTRGWGGENWVIELQNSLISTSDIRERESFYGRMLWIFHIPRYKRHLFVREKWKGENDNHFHFRWLSMRPSWLACTKAIYVDFDMGMLLLIKELHNGWGLGCFVPKNSLIYGHRGRPNIIKPARMGAHTSAGEPSTTLSLER